MSANVPSDLLYFCFFVFLKMFCLDINYYLLQRTYTYFNLRTLMFSYRFIHNSPSWGDSYSLQMVPAIHSSIYSIEYSCRGLKVLFKESSLALRSNPNFLEKLPVFGCISSLKWQSSWQTFNFYLYIYIQIWPWHFSYGQNMIYC